MVNVFRPQLERDDDPPGFRSARDRVGARAGARALGASVYELPPGEAICPYHWHSVEEELLVVLSGAPSARTPDGWRELAPGEVMAFRTGEGGAHQIANRSDAPARLILFSHGRSVEVAGYPDSDKVGVYGPLRAIFRRREAVPYFEGETPPDA